MPNQAKTIQVPPNTLIGDLALPRFLKAYDLTDRWKTDRITVTISRVAFEETQNIKELDKRTGKPTTKMEPVLYFKTKTGGEFPRGMLISAAENIVALRKATGCTTVGEIIGKRITIKTATFRKDLVLRIDPTPPGSANNPAPIDEPELIEGLAHAAPTEEASLEDIIGEAPEDPPPDPASMEEAIPPAPGATTPPVDASDRTPTQPASQGTPTRTTVLTRATTRRYTLDELQRMAKNKPMGAYDLITKQLGIDKEQAAGILKEKHNYLAAFEYVAQAFGSQLGAQG